MSELITSLGINYYNLIFQIINFSIIFAVIYIFFSKPLNQIIEERKNKIEEGLKKREEAEKLIKEVRELADKIIQEAEQKKLEILKQTEEEQVELLKKIKKEIEEKRLKMIEKLSEEKIFLTEKMKIEISNEAKEILFTLAKKVFSQADFDKKFIDQILKKTE